MKKPSTGRRDDHRQVNDSPYYPKGSPQSWQEYEDEMLMAERMARMIVGPFLKSLRT